MSQSIQIIEISRLAVISVPAGIVLAVYFFWNAGFGDALYAMVRMLVQLTLIGFVLLFIFEANSVWIVLGVLGIMVFFSAWIALRTVPARRKKLFIPAMLSILSGGGTTLLFVSWGVLQLDPWFLPRYLVPLAGMIFANAMNSVSLAAERFFSEIGQDTSYLIARNMAMKAAMIPVVNALFAVGLVSLPGMMTGQILSGVSPLIATRYQIMVMLMVFSSAGLSAILFLQWLKYEKRSDG
jgi:putative ABC transport system permease protein